MSTKEKYKALISTLLNAWGGKTTVKAAKSVEINGKFHNPVAVVVESWVDNNSSSWYRKYSDGWIEQGGVVGGKGTSSDLTVTLNHSFIITNYFVYAGPVDPKSPTLSSDNCSYRGVYQRVGSIKAKTTTTFTFGNAAYAAHWFACGY